MNSIAKRDSNSNLKLFFKSVINTIRFTALGKFIFVFMILFFVMSYIKINCMNEVIGSSSYPDYSNLKTVSGTLLTLKPGGRTPRRYIIDETSGVTYILFDEHIGYPSIRNDIGKHVVAKANNNKIVEIQVDGKTRVSYADTIYLTKQYIRFGKRLLVFNLILFIILILYSLRRLKWEK